MISQHAILVLGYSGLICGVSLLFLSLCSSPVHFCIFAAVYGFHLSPMIVLESTAIVQLVGMELLSTACGLRETLFGMVTISGPLVFGCAVDYFGNYNMPFLLAGSSYAFGAVLLFVLWKIL